MKHSCGRLSTIKWTIRRIAFVSRAITINKKRHWNQTPLAGGELQYRAIFNSVRKVIWDCICFNCFITLYYWSRKLSPPSQSDTKPKPMATWSLASCRGWCGLHVFTLSSHTCDIWLAVVITLVLVLSHSVEKRSKKRKTKHSHLVTYLHSVYRSGLVFVLPDRHNHNFHFCWCISRPGRKWRLFLCTHRHLKKKKKKMKRTINEKNSFKITAVKARLACIQVR